MSEPLFLAVICHAGEDLGWHEFAWCLWLPHYLSDHVGEYWLFQLYPNGVLLSRRVAMPVKLWCLYAEHRVVRRPSGTCLPLWLRFWRCLVYRSIQMMLTDLSMKELGKTERWYIIDAEPGVEITAQCQIKKKKNCVSKLKVRIGKIWPRSCCAGDFFMSQVVPCMPLVQESYSGNPTVKDTTYRVWLWP